MKISIVTPSYNQAAFLPQTFSSVLGQQGVDLEYVVVDGGSTDGSREIIEAHADRFAWWCSEKDAGQYDAINKGFAHTTGEVMAWINSSDAYLPWTLRTVREIFEAFPEVDWITSLYKTCIAENGGFQSIQKVPGFSARAFQCGLHGSSTDTNFIQQETCFWRRSLWDKIGGKIKPDFRFAADFHLWAEFFHHAPLVGVAAPLAVFRYHDEQRSTVDRYTGEVDEIISGHALNWKPNEPCPVQNLYRAHPSDKAVGTTRQGWRLETIPDDGILFEMADIDNALHNKEIVIRELAGVAEERLACIEDMKRAVDDLRVKADLKYQLRTTVQSYLKRLSGSK